MEKDEFWEIIDRSRRGAADDVDAQLEQLRVLLMKLPPALVLEFGDTFYSLHRASYRGNLWGAAFLIGGGCSDDAFEYFRAGLVARGRKVFEAALANPDSLAGIAETVDLEVEEFMYIPAEVYKEQTGLEDFYDRLTPGEERPPDLDFSSWSDGRGGIDTQKARVAYPQLSKKFGESEGVG